jgi:mono/diheme cytochrome c family protein
MKPQAQPPEAAALLLLIAGAASAIALALTAHHGFQAEAKADQAGSGAAQAGQVSGGDVTLVSQAVELPDDDDRYPEGAGAAVMNANCTACHSASMALNQPRLTAADWKGEVQKMRDTYKAAVADKDAPAIIDYLTRMSDRLPQRAPSRASSPTGNDAAG